MKSIDINCDMGESCGNFKVGQDEDIFPYITSCNIACGFHAGDPSQMELTIQRALKHGVQIGAHPGYPDLVGFGRRAMSIPIKDLKSLIKYQAAALKGMVESHGGKLKYVKPHGALYNSAAGDVDITNAILQALEELDDQLFLMGFAGSVMEKVSSQKSRPFIGEAFADRNYESNGTLRSRRLPDAVIIDPEKAAKQVISIVMDQQVICYDGSIRTLKAQSICVHGDNEKATDLLKAIDQILQLNDIEKSCCT